MKRIYALPNRPIWIMDSTQARECPQCHANAVLLMPDWLIADQPDETTAVCTPAFGGCNQGYALEARS